MPHGQIHGSVEAANDNIKKMNRFVLKQIFLTLIYN